jgi:hypothetical protein
LYYAHLDRHAVEEDTWVEPGDTLGFVGNTGNARTTPPHLHFGIYVRRRGPVDPYYHLFEPPGKAPVFAGDSGLVGNWGRVTASGARLRARPEPSSPVILTVPGQLPVEVLSGAGRSYLARLPTGEEGYLSLAEVRHLAPLYQAAVASEAVLRSVPGFGAAPTETVTGGEVVVVLGRYSDQVFVRDARGVLGWLGPGTLIGNGTEVGGSP